MSYTKENFEEWIMLIPFKMEYFTDIFAGENNLKPDYSIESLDEPEKCILQYAYFNKSGVQGNHMQITYDICDCEYLQTKGKPYQYDT